MPSGTVNFPVSDSQGNTTPAVLNLTINAPASNVIVMGVNDRYWDDFTAKVAPVKNVRIYLATQTVGSGSFYNLAETMAAAGITPWLTFKTTPTQSFLASFRSWIINDLDRRPVVDYYHEPDDNLSATTYINNQRTLTNGIGSSQGIRDVADISWCPRALNFGTPGPMGFTAEQYWPGDSFVDIAACDGYFKDKFPYGTPDDIFGDAYDFAVSHGKKFAVLEWGVQENFTGVTQQARANAINGFADWAAPKAANIEALLYWESGPPQVANEYQIRDDALPKAAYQAVLARPEFGPEAYPG